MAERGDDAADGDGDSFWDVLPSRDQAEHSDNANTLLGRMPAFDSSAPFNPFSNSSSCSGVYELSKTILLLPLCILRLTFFVLALVLGLAYTRIALCGASHALTRPFSKLRRKLLWPVRILARVLLFLCGFQWISIKGKPAPRSRASILVCNHITFADPMFIFYKHLPVIVTAQENLYYPMMGSIIRAMQAVVLDRASADSRRIAAGEIRRRAQCDKWSRMMLFPEATTTNGKALVSFKAGAFAAANAIQPMVVRYPYVHCDPSWVAVGPSIYYLFFRLMTQFHNFMEVEYLPVMEPTPEEVTNPRAFADRVRAAMAATLNVTVTEHSFEDVLIMEEAQKSKVVSKFAGLALLEFGRFEKLFKLRVKEAKRYFHKYCGLDVRKKGMVSLDDLLDYLRLPDCKALRELFSLFDSKSCGYFNFRQYTAGLCFIMRYARIGEAMETVFELLDGDQDGVLSTGDVWKGLRLLIPEMKIDQAKSLWGRINIKGGRYIYRVEFLNFLQRNPEYIATFIFANPSLVVPEKNEASL